MRTAKWRNFSKEEIATLVKESKSYAEIAQKLGYNIKCGSYVTTMKSMIEELELDINHFQMQAWNRNNFDYSRFQYGVAIKPANMIDAIIHLRGHRCENCGATSWLGNKIPLEVHHKDGDSLNNDLKNLTLLCPNCHALTNNYRGKNVNARSNVISDDMFVNALQQAQNIRQALRKLGLTPKGANYIRARELAVKHNIMHIINK